MPQDRGGDAGDRISVEKALELIDRAMTDIITRLQAVQAQVTEIANRDPGGPGDITNHLSN